MLTFSVICEHFAVASQCFLELFCSVSATPLKHHLFNNEQMRSLIGVRNQKKCRPVAPNWIQKMQAGLTGG